MSFRLFVLFTWGCLTLCSSQLICDVTQDQDQTSYTISNADTENCDYSWTNGSQHKLAHNKAANPELVKSHSVHTLTTRWCLSVVNYEQTCHPQGDYRSATCTASCPEKAVPPENQGGCLTLCSSQLICDVTQDQDQTSYTISNADTENCDYSWTNGSQHKLAHNKAANPELVKSHSVHTLTTRWCLSVVNYEQTCYPQGDYRSATCTASCPEKAVPPENQVSGTAMERGAATSPSPPNDEKRLGWIDVIGIIAGVVIGIGIITAILCFIGKRYGNVPQNLLQPSIRYKAGAKDVETADTGAADVEAQTVTAEELCE